MKRLLVLIGLLLAQPVFAADTLPVTVHTSQGAKTYTLELAATLEEREHGLMDRKTLKPNDGMLFVFHQIRAQRFWMKNTPLPLDVIFISPENKIITIAHGKALSEEMIFSRGVVSSVIELDAGRSARDGVRVGDKVEYALPPTVVVR